MIDYASKDFSPMPPPISSDAQIQKR